MKAGKIWGQTELIHANGVLEFHRIEYKAGYKCSEHEHQFKWNGFYVESGKMIVRVWQNDYDLVDETLLLPGDFTQVKPGCIHQFEGVTDGVAFELYWAEFNHGDIKRRSVGSENTVVKRSAVEEDPMRRVLHDLAEDNPSDIEKDYEDMRTSILGKGSVLNED
jgi:mannose-6-phosphate isomerase-like protein (cupin superfamily)